MGSRRALVLKCPQPDISDAAMLAAKAATST
jgi:hypothetical protein